MNAICSAQKERADEYLRAVLTIHGFATPRQQPPRIRLSALFP